MDWWDWWLIAQKCQEACSCHGDCLVIGTGGFLTNMNTVPLLMWLVMEGFGGFVPKGRNSSDYYFNNEQETN